MTKKERIIEAIESLATSEAVSLWNEFCNADNRMDDYIFSMYDFDEQMEGETPFEIVQRIVYGNFNPNDDYFWFNGYANLESSNYPDSNNNSPFYASEIADYILENEDDLYCSEIEDLLTEFEEEEEEAEEEEEEE